MKILHWDIFCKVIDNFGDIGICWRLAADLAVRGQQVRLWVDDSSALSWMAPGGCAGVQVLPWTESIDTSLLQTSPGDVMVEAFGCEIAPEFIAACAHIHWATAQKDPLNSLKNPVWINLEYLSAESYVARNHGLTSLVSSVPAAGWHKVFYYPGFTPETGGLLREPDLLQRQASFDRAAWLKQHSVDWNGEQLATLFCYEPPALPQLLTDLTHNGLDGQPVHLLVAAGRATEAVKTALNTFKAIKTPENTPQIGLQANRYGRGQLSISYLPLLSQTDFDHLLWACDINFVRGEDSIVRAIWAGKPFVWQIYPQDDGAHGAKLEAFLDMMQAPIRLRAFHRAWNATTSEALPLLTGFDELKQTAIRLRDRLAEQPDLATGLIGYVLKNR